MAPPRKRRHSQRDGVLAFGPSELTNHGSSSRNSTATRSSARASRFRSAPAVPPRDAATSSQLRPVRPQLDELAAALPRPAQPRLFEQFLTRNHTARSRVPAGQALVLPPRPSLVRRLSPRRRRCLPSHFSATLLRVIVTSNLIRSSGPFRSYSPAAARTKKRTSTD